MVCSVYLQAIFCIKYILFVALCLFPLFAFLCRLFTLFCFCFDFHFFPLALCCGVSFATCFGYGALGFFAVRE